MEDSEFEVGTAHELLEVESGLDQEYVLAWSATESHLPLALVSIVSAVENLSVVHGVQLVLLHDEIPSELLRQFGLRIRETTGLPIELLDMSGFAIEDSQSGFYVGAAFYRLFLPSLFPASKRILYLDTDTLVVGNLDELLYETSFKSSIAAVQEGTMLRYWVDDYPVPRWIGVKGTRDYFENVLKIPPQDYFNSGVLLYQPALINVDSFSSTVMNRLQGGKFWFADQCLLSSMVSGDFFHLDKTWNSQVGDFWPFGYPVQRVKILHFSGWFRPWMMLMPARLGGYGSRVRAASNSLGVSHPLFANFLLRLWRSVALQVFRILPVQLKKAIRGAFTWLR